MERTTFCLLFYIRRTKLNRNGEAPIMMRITVNGVRVDASVKKTILPEFWSAAKGKALEKKREYKELNLYLDSIRLRIMKIQRELEIEEVSVSANSVLDRFQGKDAPVQRTLFEVFREHNDKCVQLSGTDMAPATVQRYETSLKHTRDFVWETYHKKDVLLDEVSRQFIEDYEFWLKTEKKCCHNTATKYLKNFKKIIRIALAKGWMKNDPFLEIRFSLDKVEPDFLEDSEIQKLISKEIDIPRLSQVRDIFVFCCFTGLAFSDIHGLRKEHIVEDSNGVRWIRKGRQKTKIMCNIPLMEIPLKILEKYSTNEYCKKHGVLFPVLCNQKMNAYLKELADICGIKKTLTTHEARHNKNYIYLNMKGLRLKRNRLVNGLETSELLYSSSFCIKRKNFLTFAKVQNFTRFHEFPKTFFHSRWKSHATLTLLAKQDLPTFGYNMIAPLKSWCWGSILFYPFKISRFS